MFILVLYLPCLSVILFTRHAFGVYFALYNFVRGLPAIHFESGKFLAAVGAGHVAVGVVFGNAI